MITPKGLKKLVAVANPLRTSQHPVVGCEGGPAETSASSSPAVRLLKILLGNGDFSLAFPSTHAPTKRRKDSPHDERRSQYYRKHRRRCGTGRARRQIGRAH